MKSTYEGTTTLEVLEGAENYNKWIADSVKRHMTGPVLEIGAGTGNISQYFIKVTNFVITDTDQVLVKTLKTRFKKYKRVTVQSLDISKPQGSNKHSFSTVFAVNVFEHIKDDITAMRNTHSLLKKNGKFILLVPAKRFAYTKLDKNLGHFRRYEKDELREKLEQTGFVVEKVYFFNIVGLLSWMVRDRIEKNNVQLDPGQIALFDKIVPFLRVIETVIPVPIGISLIAVARKK